MIWWTLRKLKSGDARVREKAISKLVKKGGPGVVRGLQKLLDHKKADVREAAVCTIAQIRSAEADDALMTGLGNKDERVRRVSAEVLRRLSDMTHSERLSPSLADNSPTVRMLVVQILAGMNDPVVLSKVEPLLADSDGGVKAEAARAFARLGTEAERPVFMRMLKDESDTVRQSASTGLSRIDKLKHAESGNILSGTDYWFRKVADEPKAPGSHNIYLSRQNPVSDPEKEAAREKAGKVSSLLAVLRDGDKDIRMTAAVQLGKIGDSSTLAPLSVLLNDPSPEVSAAAQDAIDAVKGLLPEDLGFHGVLRKVGLADVIQLECLNRNSSIIEVRTDEEFGRIFICDGQIIHSEIGRISGIGAFNQIMCLPGGQFQIKDFVPSETHTIEGGWEFLIMEAARLRDEMRIR